MAVYFITAREVGRVKIGYTDGTPRDRFNWINANSPVAVALEAVLEGGREQERAFHIKFAEHCVKGEWFALCPEIEALIEAGKPQRKPEPEPGSVEEIVRKHGSASALARKLGVPMTTVASWRQKNRIPRWRLEAIRSLEAEGC